MFRGTRGWPIIHQLKFVLRDSSSEGRGGLWIWSIGFILHVPIIPLPHSEGKSGNQQAGSPTQGEDPHMSLRYRQSAWLASCLEQIAVAINVRQGVTEIPSSILCHVPEACSGESNTCSFSNLIDWTMKLAVTLGWDRRVAVQPALWHLLLFDCLQIHYLRFSYFLKVTF